MSVLGWQLGKWTRGHILVQTSHVHWLKQATKELTTHISKRSLYLPPSHALDVLCRKKQQFKLDLIEQWVSEWVSFITGRKIHKNTQDYCLKFTNRGHLIIYLFIIYFLAAREQFTHCDKAVLQMIKDTEFSEKTLEVEWPEACVSVGTSRFFEQRNNSLFISQ